MTPSEFFFHLNKLPEDTPLTAWHIKGIFEVLKPLIEDKVSTGKPEKKAGQPFDIDKSPNGLMIDENDLAYWINEPVSTIQKWRMKGTGPEYLKNKANGSVRYKVGVIRDWIEGNMVTSTSQADVKRFTKFQGMTFNGPSVYMRYEDEKVAFFSSLDRDDDPTDICIERTEYFERLEDNLAAWFIEAQPVSFAKIAEVVSEAVKAGADINKPTGFFVDGTYTQITLAELLATLSPSALREETECTDAFVTLLNLGLELPGYVKEGESALAVIARTKSLHDKLDSLLPPATPKKPRRHF